MASSIRLDDPSPLSNSAELRADQTEHDNFSLRDESQRLESSGALVVVFEQEAIAIELVEDLVGDGVIAALGVPVAAIVAATQMDGQRHAGSRRRREAERCRRESIRRAARPARAFISVRMNSRHFGR